MEPKAKLMSLGLIFVIAILGFFTFNFWKESEELKTVNQKLKKDTDKAKSENSDLNKRLAEFKRKAEQLTSEIDLAKKEKDRAISDRDKLKDQVDTAEKDRKQLKEALTRLQSEKAKENTPVIVTASEASKDARVSSVTEKGPSGAPDDVSWEKVVKEKAVLKAKSENMEATLKEKDGLVKDLEKERREVKSKLDDLIAQREEMSRELEFNKRTIDILSADLVKEKEDKRLALKEVKRLRSENSNLNRELHMLGKNKQNLEDKLQNLEDMKSTLESKMLDVQTTLRERSLEIGDMQDKLVNALDKVKKGVSLDGSTVELAPIVVKQPDYSAEQTSASPNMASQRPAAPKGMVKGAVIAVNKKENFVVIDVGESAGLAAGEVLNVVRGDKKIALVKIIELRKEISACDITTMQPGEFIREGDSVIVE